MIKYFWLILSLGCIGWYLIVLGYVAVKGGADIKDMLKSLSVGVPADETEDISTYNQTTTQKPKSS